MLGMDSVNPIPSVVRCFNKGAEKNVGSAYSRSAEPQVELNVLFMYNNMMLADEDVPGSLPVHPSQQTLADVALAANKLYWQAIRILHSDNGHES
jgi:hypothetical protein